MASGLALVACLFGMGIGTIELGLRGFQPDGLPFTRERRITGPPGKIIGVLCVLLGLGIFACMAFVWKSLRADGVTEGFQHGFMIGAVTYLICRSVILLRSGPWESEMEDSERPRAKSKSRKVSGIVECPHCHKTMVDTAADRCRFCGEDWTSSEGGLPDR